MNSPGRPLMTTSEVSQFDVGLVRLKADLDADLYLRFTEPGIQFVRFAEIASFIRLRYLLVRSEPLRRRSFLGLIGGTAALWPVALSAQRPALPLIGFLNSSAPENWT